ncbi:hypothetical protein H7R39_03995 [Campylobacter sp. Marseille-Q3452]|uniref:Uncharacterized protein n=1 Tax=Campylobacter massiliensis TaxID=2762557 RepID=A0A842J7A8_9BACT|nr:hypothetical protein [Campylobacter massiliensis]MBC2882435.1 hypothetical protein [Campylobacter massiliensis]
MQEQPEYQSMELICTELQSLVDKIKSITDDLKQALSSNNLISLAASLKEIHKILDLPQKLEELDIQLSKSFNKKSQSLVDTDNKIKSTVSQIEINVSNLLSEKFSDSQAKQYLADLEASLTNLKTTIDNLIEKAPLPISKFEKLNQSLSQVVPNLQKTAESMKTLSIKRDIMMVGIGFAICSILGLSYNLFFINSKINEYINNVNQAQEEIFLNFKKYSDEISEKSVELKDYMLYKEIYDHYATILQETDINLLKDFKATNDGRLYLNQIISNIHVEKPKPNSGNSTYFFIKVRR